MHPPATSPGKPAAVGRAEQPSPARGSVRPHLVGPEGEDALVEVGHEVPQRAHHPQPARQQRRAQLLQVHLARRRGGRDSLWPWGDPGAGNPAGGLVAIMMGWQSRRFLWRRARQPGRRRGRTPPWSVIQAETFLAGIAVIIMRGRSSLASTRTAVEAGDNYQSLSSSCSRPHYHHVYRE